MRLSFFFTETCTGDVLEVSRDASIDEVTAAPVAGSVSALSGAAFTSFVDSSISEIVLSNGADFDFGADVHPVAITSSGDNFVTLLSNADTRAVEFVVDIAPGKQLQQLFVMWELV